MAVAEEKGCEGVYEAMQKWRRRGIFTHCLPQAMRQKKAALSCEKEACT